MRKILLKNSISGIIQMSITTILTFIGIPVFIREMGSDAYGVFALVSVIGNLNTFVDLGLNSSLIKFLAEQGKCRESNFDILVTLALLITILLPLTMVVYFLKNPILMSVLNVPEPFFEQASILYTFLLAANFLLFIGNVFSSILIAMQKLYKSNYIQLIYNFIYWSLLIIVILLKHDLAMVGKIVFMATIVWFVAIVFASLFEWGGIPSVEGFSENYIRIVKKQVAYGFKIYVSGLLMFLYVPLTKVLISNFVGIKEVGFFEIAINIRNRIASLISKAVQPLYPMISEIKDVGKIRLLVHDIAQKILFVSMPLIAVIVFCTKPFLHLWIGGDVNIIAAAVIFVAGFYLIAVVGTPNYNFLTAKNKVINTIILQAINVGLNAFLILILYSCLGFYSIIVGNSAAIFASFLVNIYYQKKYLDSLVFDRSSQLFKLISVFAILLVVGYIMNLWLTGDWLKLIIIPLLFFVLTVLLYRQLRLLELKDIERYFGKDNYLANLTKKVFIKNS